METIYDEKTINIDEDIEVETNMIESDLEDTMELSEQLESIRNNLEDTSTINIKEVQDELNN